MLSFRAGTIQGSFDSVRFRFKTVRFGFFRIGSVHVEENLLCKGKSNPCSTIPLSNDKN